jgi:hypothetical protein
MALNQGPWLVANVQDVQSHGGVCHAMGTEWVFAQLQNRPWNAQSEYWRGVSHQRAYALAWQERLRGHWGGGLYNQYLHIALQPTERFVQDPARRQGQPFHSDHVHSLNHLTPHILAMGTGVGLVIVMFGSNPAWLANSQNWGHTVAVTRDAGGTYRFLDVNQGQYSWPPGTPGSTVGREVEHNLRALGYDNWGIRDIYLFRIG